MASSASLRLILFIAAVVDGFHGGTASPPPHAFLLPVTKDASTLQYLTEIRHGDGSPRPLTLVLDLSGAHIWTSTASPTRLPIPLRSLRCLSAGKSAIHRPRKGGTCEVISENAVTGLATGSELSEGVLSFQSSRDHCIPAMANLLFALSPEYLLSGLARHADGMLGLGRDRTALPEQLAAASGGDRRFFLCLSESNGVVAVGGDWPWTDVSSTSPWLDISKSMAYVPLLTSDSGSSGGYHVKLTAVEVNGERLTLNSSSFMKLSTAVPYTTMESSIYKEFAGAFLKAAAAMNIARSPVPSGTPFDLCFKSGSIRTMQTGPEVPEIDLILQSEMTRWRVHGKNSMVQVDDTTCLGILNGGPRQKAGVVLGGHQQEDVLVEFDLTTSMLGFSGSLLTSHNGKRCSDFAVQSQPAMEGSFSL